MSCHFWHKVIKKDWLSCSCVLSRFFPDYSFLEKPAANGQDHATRSSGLRSTASMEWKLWTIMKAKKERYMMLGAWTGGEMGLAEQWNRPQRRKKRKGAEFCSQRGHAWWKEDTQQRTARGKAAWAQKAGSKGSKPGGVQGPDLGRFGMHPKGNWKSQKAFKLRVKWSDLHFQQVTLITTSTQETRVDLGRSFRNLLPASRQEMILAVSR